jgi:hypothetical protein
MLRNKYFSWAVAILLLSAVWACDRSAFKLTSADSRYDSLFLGVSLRMDKKAFYDHCWEMNRKKLVTHGPKNQEVEYRLEKELKSPAYMRFYPTFYNDKIIEMPVLFNYESWAPWNKQYSSDSLLMDLLPLFKKWYGDDFKLLQHERMGKVFYKMDGRRRINLFVRDDQFVQAVFSDMQLLKEQEESKKDEKPAK